MARRSVQAGDEAVTEASARRQEPEGEGEETREAPTGAEVPGLVSADHTGEGR